MKVIITLSTIPNRLMDPNEHMGTKLGFETILNQSYKDYEVHFNIPFIYKKLNQKILIPSWLDEYASNYTYLKIFRTEDYGPITKILPTLERVDDPETVIITVDDDLYYMNGIIEAHLKARKKYPDEAIGFAGISAIDGSCHFCTSVQSDVRVKILEGYKTVSYKRSFFDIKELKNNFLDKSWNDDLILSAYMGYKNIAKIVIAHDEDMDFSPRVESFPIIGHTPVERGGCFEFRNDKTLNKISDDNINNFYKLGYLER
jgi:hypothetical protein